ncbi:MAG: DUF4143 domain-containing protein [Gammaproteobacteria bacterium]
MASLQFEQALLKLQGYGHPRHPKLGASWEGFVIEQVILAAGARNACYWETQGGAELNLMLDIRGRRCGVEVKYSDAPRLSKSMTTAMHDLRLHTLYVVYPGQQGYPLRSDIEALPLSALLAEIQAPRGRKGRASLNSTSSSSAE